MSFLLHRSRLVFLTVALLLPTRVVAQDWTQPWADPLDRPPRVDVSATAGVVAPTDWSDLVVLGSLSSATGALEQVLVRDVRVEPGSTFGASATYWRARYGFRVHGAFSDSSLAFGSSFDASDDALGSIDVDTWTYDVRGAVGLIEYAPNRIAWPYVFVGLGGITYDLSRTVSPPLLTFIEQPPPGGSRDTVIVEDNGRQFVVAVDELGLETVFAFNFGIGTDFRIPLGPGGIGVRLELSDHISPSPLTLRIRQLGVGGLTGADSVRFGMVHHLRAAAGLVVQIGR
jgi:hypothetical protein